MYLGKRVCTCMSLYVLMHPHRVITANNQFSDASIAFLDIALGKASRLVSYGRES
jgi:hypothetical protein